MRPLPGMNSSPPRHLLNAIVDRPPRKATPAVAAAWLTFMAGLLVGGEIEDAASFAFTGVSGAALVFLGLAAASRCRALPRRMNVHRARLALLSLAVGTGSGIANLAANWMIAEADPTLRALLVEHFAAVEPLEALVASPIVEEVAVRRRLV
jgi:hypothetical protein